MTTEPPQGDEALITTKQAAAILGLSVVTVTRMARAGELPPAHKGEGLRGGYLFRLEVVNLLKAERDQEAATETQPPTG